MNEQIFQLKSCINEKLIETITENIKINSEELFPQSYITTSSLLEKVDRLEAITFNELQRVEIKLSDG